MQYVKYPLDVQSLLLENGPPKISSDHPKIWARNKSLRACQAC